MQQMLLQQRKTDWLNKQAIKPCLNNMEFDNAKDIDY